jgi:hypothetical protein
MKYAVETGSCAMKHFYIPSFVKIGLAIQKLVRETHRQHGDRISIISFFEVSKLVKKG